MRRSSSILACLLVAAFGCVAPAAQVILNEYNAVSGDNQLDDGDGADLRFGTIDGNGGNWFELLVIEDQVDMRGWTFVWEEDEEVGNTGENASGVITLADASIWSGLRSGTLITFIETADAGGEGAFDTGTDLSYDPLAGDWWINVSTREEQAKGAAGVVSTVTNDGPPGDFSVGRYDWTVSILDAASQIVFGPAGEGASNWAGDGVSNTDGAALEGPLGTPTYEQWQAVTPGHPDYDDTGSTSFGAPNADYDSATSTFPPLQDLSALRERVQPTPDGDFDEDGVLTANDIDILSTAVRDGSTDPRFDLDQNQIVDDDDRTVWVKQIRRTYFGDADLDGSFDTIDFVTVFQEGEYEDDVEGNSGWATGDWTGDAEFDSSDFVRAFQDGGYEIGPMPATVVSVPEPASLTLALTCWLGLTGLRRHRRRNGSSPRTSPKSPVCPLSHR